MRHILRRKSGRKRRQICRPMLSGPTEKKKVACTRCSANARKRFGTPSCVPRKVSTSIRKPTLPRLTRGFPFYTVVFPCFKPLLEKEIKRGRDGHLQIDLGLPMEQPPRIPDTGTAMLKILIAGAIVSTALRLPESCKGWKPVAQWVLVEHLDQHLRKLADTRLIIGIAEIDNLAVAPPSFILNDAKEVLRFRREYP